MGDACDTYRTSNPTVDVSPGTVTPGQPVDISVNHFPSTGPIRVAVLDGGDVSLDNPAASGALALSSGTGSSRLTIPAGAPPGSYTVVVYDPAQADYNAQTQLIVASGPERLSVTPHRALGSEDFAVLGSGFQPSHDVVYLVVANPHTVGWTGELLAAGITQSDPTGAVSFTVKHQDVAAPGSYLVYVAYNDPAVINTAFVASAGFVVPDTVPLRVTKTGAGASVGVVAVAAVEQWMFGPLPRRLVVFADGSNFERGMLRGTVVTVNANVTTGTPQCKKVSVEVEPPTGVTHQGHDWSIPMTEGRTVNVSFDSC
jgi:hypothetical protein